MFTRCCYIICALFLTQVTTQAAWTHGAYVWQRQVNRATHTALQTTGKKLNSLCMLAAEMTWNNNALVATRIPLNHAQLVAFGKPLGLALRVGTVPNGLKISDFAKPIADEALAILKAARAAGLDPTEIELDYDCAESKLADYRLLLTALREALSAELALGKTSLSFTALPAWLRHETEFVALAREAASTGGGFTLQVHSLEKPTDITTSITLCDTDKALEWTRKANHIALTAKARFRVALPTYGYTLGFDSRGKFIGLAAETPRDWPANTQTRTLRADPVALQKLAQTLADQNLPQLTGIIWFRLPIEGDRLAWNPDTFSAVIQNTPLVSRIEIEARRTQELGVYEIVVCNRGQTTELLPETIILKWTTDGVVAAADGLGYYTFASQRTAQDAATSSTQRTQSEPSSVSLYRTRLSEKSEITAGKSRIIGWIRFQFLDDNNRNTFSIHANIP